MKGPETAKNHFLRGPLHSKYMRGSGLDIGCGPYDPDLPSAIGVDLNYPGYDGKRLPFTDESQDYVFSSHCLEHIEDYKTSIREWFRVLRFNGYMIICVPHQYLYEKRNDLPSRYNGDHKRFYKPQDLLYEIDESLEYNSWRLVHCRDNDDNFDYSIPPEVHSAGSYEIECVIKKIQKPAWKLA